MWRTTHTKHASYFLALHCIALHCIALHCIALHCIALHCTALHCIALHCIALHCIALHCIALHCIALHCIAIPLPDPETGKEGWPKKLCQEHAGRTPRGEVAFFSLWCRDSAGWFPVMSQKRYLFQMLAGLINSPPACPIGDGDGELHNKNPPTPCLWQAPASTQKTKRKTRPAIRRSARWRANLPPSSPLGNFGSPSGLSGLGDDELNYYKKTPTPCLWQAPAST